MNISIKSAQDIEQMRVAGRMAAETLEMIRPQVVAGITTGELDRICHDYIVNKLDAIPAPLNYNGFPKSICTSVNEVVCHGIPSDKRALKNGDQSFDLAVTVSVVMVGRFHGIAHSQKRHDRDGRISDGVDHGGQHACRA